MWRGVSYVLAFLSIFVGVAILGEIVPKKAWIVILAAAALLCTVGSAAFITRCWERKSCAHLPAAAGGIGALTWCVLLLLRYLQIVFPAYLWLVPLPLVGFQLFSLFTGGEAEDL